MGKLVRDRVPELVAATTGPTPAVRRLSETEFEEALLSKLLEEVTELLQAPHEERLEEAADVLEVLTALVGLQGLGCEDIVAEADQKREARGGFDDRLWWDPRP